MTINTYQKGDLPRLTALFKNSAGTATDPTTVRFKYTTPAGATTTLVYGVDGALVKDSTGNYHVDLSLTAAGMWFYRWEGEGTVQSVQEGELTVEPSGF